MKEEIVECIRRPRSAVICCPLKIAFNLENGFGVEEISEFRLSEQVGEESAIE
jgi:hypothetical protein